MSAAKYAIKLTWKPFNINLNMIHTWMQENAGPEYAGIQGSQQLEIWFKERPDAETEAAVIEYYHDLEEDSDEATSYKTFDEIQEEAEAAKAAAKASAKAKLSALGLTDEEIEALKG